MRTRPQTRRPSIRSPRRSAPTARPGTSTSRRPNPHRRLLPDRSRLSPHRWCPSPTGRAPQTRPTAPDGSMAHVAVVFTGGTISTAFDAVAGGNVPTLDGAEILARTPGLDEIADVVAIDRGRTPASHFTFPALLEIAGVLREALADSTIDGAVVVQGTDTIEETAFCWDLVLDDAKPVV